MARESFANKNPDRDVRCQEKAEGRGFADWWAWVRSIEKEVGRDICGAPRRRLYSPCKVRPNPANGRCTRYHSGNAVIGPAHPSYVHGQYSTLFDYLPGHLKQTAEAVIDDEILVQSREEIAVLKAHSRDLLRRGLDTGESGAAWRSMGRWMQALTRALNKENEQDTVEAVRRLQELVMVGVGEGAVWSEYQQVVENARRSKETELTRMKHLSAFIAADRAAAIFQKLMDIVQTHVHDTDVLRLILSDIDRVFGRGTEQGTAQA